MPIYEYECRDCGKVSEFLVGVTKDKAEIKCGSCGSRKLDKLFSQSFVSTGNRIIGSQEGKTCCGRAERCDTPPCSGDGICKR
jgi:putative FmdB family regulatory protein